ncbi:MAG TPA: glycosyltransferase [Nitrospirae bacterium]|nr:glycosyltransferase [Nitrospirota bacterium]
MSNVSIIVPIFNDARFIDKCIQSLKNQTYPKDLYEIIIIDDGSTDETAQVVGAVDGITYIYQDNNGPSIARNRGISIARGEFVAFTDSDCEVKNDWLEQLIKRFDESVAGVGGMQIGHPDDNEFAKKVDKFLRAIGFIGDYVKPHKSIKEVSHNASCNSAYRRRVIQEVGGFREGMFPGEDVDLDKRLRDKGYKIFFTPAAVVYHHRPDSSQKWHRMLINYGQASADNVRLHGFFRLIQVIPILVPIFLFIFLFFLYLHLMITLVLTCFLCALSILVLKYKTCLSLGDTIILLSETVLLFCYGFYKRIILGTNSR